MCGVKQYIPFPFPRPHYQEGIYCFTPHINYCHHHHYCHHRHCCRYHHLYWRLDAVTTIAPTWNINIFSCKPNNKLFLWLFSKWLPNIGKHVTFYCLQKMFTTKTFSIKTNGTLLSIGKLFSSLRLQINTYSLLSQNGGSYHEFN